VIQILKPCQREIDILPLEVKEDLADALARLQEGHKLSLPLSRPMPSIGKRVHELRLKDRSGIYRVVYFIKTANNIYLLHSFKKKTSQTPKENIETARSRLKGVLK
jgi:phage-related protein